MWEHVDWNKLVNSSERQDLIFKIIKNIAESSEILSTTKVSAIYKLLELYDILYPTYEVVDSSLG